MVKKSNPEGFEVHHRYDRVGRCIETWCAYPGKRNPALSDRASNVLADGSPAKGMLHVKLDYVDEGYTEVVTSRGVHRYHTNAIGKIDLVDSGSGVHTNTYDEFGKIKTYTNAEQATWRWERDEHGNVVATIDPLGYTTSRAYDERGHLIQSTDENGISRWYDRDQYGALLAARDERGQLIASRYDEAGNPIEVVLPNGGVTRMAYDEMGNRVLVQEPNGATRHIEYDYLGRVVGMTDELGGVTRYTYGARGELLLTELSNGARIRNVYDREGNLTHFTTADGKTYELRYAGLGLVYEVRKPDGTRACFRYDREGDLVEVENEKGEQHVIERSVTGYIVEDATFDGRRMRYAFDSGGQLTSVTESGGEVTHIQYDPVGRISGRSYADGTQDRFEYDGLGHLIASDNGTVACRFEYDDRCNLVRESQTFAGETHSVEHDYDAMGKVRETRTSLGYQQATSYDVMGNLVSLQLGDDGPVRFQRDVFGLEVARLLPGGGLVQTRRDVMGMPISRRLLHAGGQAPTVGALEPQALHEKVYRWSLGGKLVNTLDSELGPTEYQYDPAGHLTARLPAHARREIFSYEPAGNLHDDEARRDYALGGRLLRRGNTAFVYDASHRLTEKHVDTIEGKQVWRYAWDGRGLLRAVTLPDGSTVEHTYDSYARRVQKRRLSKTGAVLSVVRYVWNGDHVVHELCESANDNADAVVLPFRRETTYAFAPESLQPLAHRVRAGQSDATGDGVRATNAPWVHYLEGNAGTPELLVAGDGRILAHLDGKAFGRVTYERGSATANSAYANGASTGGGYESGYDGGAATATDLRFYGHIEDPETGLFYNRYRHYDPDTGRYISPEPLGLMGGLSPFGYAANGPVGMVDPDGLAPLVPVSATVTGGGVNGSSLSQSGRNSTDLHDIVKNALPKGVQSEGQTIYPAGERHPSTCAEPQALSNYIRAWEKKHNNGKSLNPDDPRDRNKIKKCLGNISKIEAKQGEKNRAMCPNCSQLMSNLTAKWGAPKDRVVVPGHVTDTDPLNPTIARREAPDKRWIKGRK